MKKILIVSTVSRQFYLFEQGNIEVLKSLGYEIHGAANFDDANERLDELDIIRHHFDIQRSPFSLKNIKAFRQLKKIMQSENFCAVHCHSPMGGVLARLAAKSSGIYPVIYTAHGFHFYRGAPCKNWLIYYNIEKYLSKYTDILVTINKEDYARAKDFYSKKVVFVPASSSTVQQTIYKAYPWINKVFFSTHCTYDDTCIRQNSSHSSIYICRTFTHAMYYIVIAFSDKYRQSFNKVQFTAHFGQIIGMR